MQPNEVDQLLDEAIDYDPDAARFNDQVQTELQRLRIRAEANRRHDLETASKAEPFDAGTIRQILARPVRRKPRVENLIPWNSSTLICAQRKTGKTTLELNLADSLLTGNKFLGAFTTEPLTGNVAVLNFEVNGEQLATWADEIGVDLDRCLLVNLRGRRNPLRYPADRADLAAMLRAHKTESLIVDPFGRAYTGTSQNDTGEVTAFLTDLEVFARAEVGALDLMVCAHAGWNAERTRGSSALEDWPDSIITLVKDPETGQRYIRAEGRDVDLDERELGFTSRRLHLTGLGSRKQAQADARNRDQERVILDLLTDHDDPVKTNRLEQIANGHGVGFQKGDVSRACHRLLNKGLVHQDIGHHGAKLWSRVVIEGPGHDQ